MKVRCNINGLDCPHCALELEKKMAKADGINSAQINYPLKSLVVDVADDADEEEIESLLQKVADDFEDGIVVELKD